MNPKQTVRLLTRYVKDLSFENPGAPASFGVTDPEITVSVQIDARPHGDLHEVAVTLTAVARRESTVLWLAEIIYVGLFEISEVEESVRRRFLFVDAPTALFPWIDRIVADAARDGGLPTLNLSPPDFEALYSGGGLPSDEMHGEQA